LRADNAGRIEFAQTPGLVMPKQFELKLKQP